MGASGRSCNRGTLLLPALNYLELAAPIRRGFRGQSTGNGKRGIDKLRNGPGTVGKRPPTEAASCRILLLNLRDRPDAANLVHGEPYLVACLKDIERRVVFKFVQVCRSVGSADCSPGRQVFK